MVRRGGNAPPLCEPLKERIVMGKRARKRKARKGKPANHGKRPNA